MGCLGVSFQVGRQALAGREEFLLIDDVVPIKHGPRFVAGQQHGDPFGDARPNQVTRGGPSAIVQEAVRDVGLPTRVAQGVTPHPDRDAVASKHPAVARRAGARSTIQYVP